MEILEFSKNKVVIELCASNMAEFLISQEFYLTDEKRDYAGLKSEDIEVWRKRIKRCKCNLT